MSYNFLLNNSVYAVLDNGKYPVGTTEGLNSISLSSSLGMGMEYNLTDNLSLNLEPTFRYYLNPFNSGKTGSHPYSLGVFSGISYKF
jgi:opacity protein-like surface antigen